MKIRAPRYSREKSSLAPSRHGCLVFGLALCFLAAPAAAEETRQIRILTEWTEDDGPIRVDCGAIPITGDGFGGGKLSCEDRLSLYALFNCYPMKKEEVEESCPDWKGLEAAIDWQAVAELIDARGADREQERREIERLAAKHLERKRKAR